MRTVSIRQALTEFLEQSSAEDNQLYDEISLLRWAKKADISIGGLYTFKREAKLYEANDNIVTLDNSVVKVFKVLLGDHTDKDIYNINETSSFYATVSITENQENYLSEYQLWSDISNMVPDETYINYFVQNGKLILPIEYKDREVTVISFSYDKDQDGDIMVNENHIDAIVAVLKHKIIDKDILSRKLRGKRIFSDDFAIQKDLRYMSGHEIRNARVRDKDDNEMHEGKNAGNVVSILIQYKDYEL